LSGTDNRTFLFWANCNVFDGVLLESHFVYTAEATLWTILDVKCY